MAINNYSLCSVAQEVFNPGHNLLANSDVSEFLDQLFMINLVKGLAKVEEAGIDLLSFIHQYVKIV